MSIGLNLLIGYAGQFSLGSCRADGDRRLCLRARQPIAAKIPALVLVGGNVWIGMVPGVIAAGIAGAALAFPVLRLKGPYLAMVTVAFGWVVWKVLLTWTSVTGGDLGITAIPRPRMAGHVFNVTDYYYLSGSFARRRAAAAAEPGRLRCRTENPRAEIQRSRPWPRSASTCIARRSWCSSSAQCLPAAAARCLPICRISSIRTISSS